MDIGGCLMPLLIPDEYRRRVIEEIFTMAHTESTVTGGSAPVFQLILNNQKTIASCLLVILDIVADQKNTQIRQSLTERR